MKSNATKEQNRSTEGEKKNDFKGHKVFSDFTFFTLVAAVLDRTTRCLVFLIRLSKCQCGLSEFPEENGHTQDKNINVYPQ